MPDVPRELSVQQRNILMDIAAHGGRVAPAMDMWRDACMSRSTLNSAYRSLRRLRSRGLVDISLPKGTRGGGMQVALTDSGRQLAKALDDRLNRVLDAWRQRGESE